MSISVRQNNLKMPDTFTTPCNANSENSAEKADADTEYISTRYDDRTSAVKLSRAIASAIIKIVELDEDSTILMEYACGTGKFIRN